MTATVGVIAGGIACGDWIKALGSEGPEGMVTGGRMALILARGRSAGGEPERSIDPAPEEGTAV
jgi:hypothetical protein